MGYLSKIRLLFVFLLSSICLSISAEIILIENFSKQSFVNWISYTNDDNAEDGWILKSGMAIQTAINGDQKPGGGRFLVKNDVLDLLSGPYPINISLDILPLDYKEPEEVWYGLGLGNPSNLDKSGILCVLRKDEERQISGLHIFVCGKWVAEPNNFAFSVMKWARLKLQIDKKEDKDSISIKVKSWSDSAQEPSEWQTSFEIQQPQKALIAKDIFLGAYAKLGKKGNPRVAFDNVMITRGDAIVPLHVFSSSESDLSETILTLFTEKDLTEQLLSRTNKIEPQNLNYAGYDKLMFLQMLSLRNIARWAEARTTANDLVLLFPDSPYSAKMGGVDGRTEDQAAEDMAEIMKPYHDKNYSQARELIKEYMKNYPQNWRIERCQYLAGCCLYYQYNFKGFLTESAQFLIDNPDTSYLVDILMKQAASFNHLGKTEESLQIQNLLKEYHPDAEAFQKEKNFLVLDSYYNNVINSGDKQNQTENVETFLSFCDTVLEQSKENKSISGYNKVLKYLMSFYNDNLEKPDEYIKFIEKEIAEGDGIEILGRSRFMNFYVNGLIQAEREKDAVLEPTVQTVTIVQVMNAPIIFAQIVQGAARGPIALLLREIAL
jgi:hypothetical protein